MTTKLKSHSPEEIPKPCRPDGGLVLDPETLLNVDFSVLPADFSVVLHKFHMPWVDAHTRNPDWMDAKFALKRIGYNVVEWHDTAAQSFCARCTLTT